MIRSQKPKVKPKKKKKNQHCDL